MTVESVVDDYEVFLHDWEELCSAGAHTFARHEMREATEQFPDRPELWFLRGQSDLSARDLPAAKESFEKAMELLTDPNRSRRRHDRRWAAVEQCLPSILEGLEQRILTDGPPTPWAWLSDPESVRSRNPLLVGRVDKPMGRTEPLMPLTPAPPHEHLTGITKGVLGEHLIPVDIGHDSMKSLLGKDTEIRIDVHREPLIDPDLKIEIGKIRIMDNSVVLEKPELPSMKVHGEERSRPQPKLPQVSIERPATAPVRPKPVPPSQPRTVTKVAEAPGKQVPPKHDHAAPKPKAGKKSSGESWDEWEQRMIALAGGGALHEAMVQIDQAINRYPASSRLQEVKARVLETRGEYESAAEQWVETYRKAVEAGSNERADRAFQQAKELAKENGDLLMDLAALAVSAGSVSMALAVGKLAVDVYRRRDDRTKLTKALQQLYEWAPNDVSIRSELERITAGVAERTREIAESARNAWPPKPGAAPGLPDKDQFEVKTGQSPRGPDSYRKVVPPPLKRKKAPLSDDDRRQRAMDMEWNKPGEVLKETSEGPDFGTFILIGSVILLLMSFAGSAVPGIIGLIISQKYLAKARKERPDESHSAAKIATGLCIAAIIFGFIIR